MVKNLKECRFETEGARERVVERAGKRAGGRKGARMGGRAEGRTQGGGCRWAGAGGRKWTAVSVCASGRLGRLLDGREADLVEADESFRPDLYVMIHIGEPLSGSSRRRSVRAERTCAPAGCMRAHALATHAAQYNPYTPSNPYNPTKPYNATSPTPPMPP